MIFLAMLSYEPPLIGLTQMGSWIKCDCGQRINKYLFCGNSLFLVISEDFFEANFEATSTHFPSLRSKSKLPSLTNVDTSRRRAYNIVITLAVALGRTIVHQGNSGSIRFHPRRILSDCRTARRGHWR
jgi:hypothetical protein